MSVTALTQQEGKVFENFCATHRIEMYGPNGDKNGELFSQQLQSLNLDPNVELTDRVLSTVLAAIKDALVFLTVDEVEFRKVYSKLSAQERATFDSWVRPRGLKNTAGNNFIILSWVRAHGNVTERSLALCVSQISVGPRLEWERTGDQSWREKSHANKTFGQDQPSSDEEFSGGRRNHAHKPEAAQAHQAVTSQGDKRWWQMANELRGQTHSQTAEAMAIVEDSGRATYEARRRFLEGRGASI